MKYRGTEVTCSECDLPSHRGLPPMVAVRRFVDGEFKKILRHPQCPDDPDGIKAILKVEREQTEEMWRKYRLWDDKHVVSYHTDKDGKQQRLVIT